MEKFTYTEPTLQELCDWLNNFYKDYKNKKHKFSVQCDTLYLGKNEISHNENHWREIVRNKTLSQAIKNGLKLHISEFSFVPALNSEINFYIKFIHNKTQACVDIYAKAWFYVNPETLCYEWE